MRLQQLCSVLNEERPPGGASSGQAEQTAHNLSLQRRFDWLLRHKLFTSTVSTAANLASDNCQYVIYLKILKNKYTAHI